MKVVRWLLAMIAVGLIFVFGFKYGRWYSTRPAVANGGRKIRYYVDPMHTWYKSDKPGFAPDCGMKLEPVYERTSAAEAPAADDAVQVPKEQQERIGIRYGTAEWSTGNESLHLVARIVPDETLVTRVQARTDGWITKVSADFVGKFITKGQPLLTLYSPELLAAQQEYLLALRAQTVMQHSSMQESSTNSNALAEAAKRKLLLLSLSETQIAEIEHTQKAPQSITLYAPATGYVMTRNAFPGQRITADTELYRLVNLSRVWVMADVFEADVQRVRTGQAAHVSIPGTGESIFTRVSNLQPQVDPATRTLKVRLDLANPRMQLRPDMWVDVDIDVAAAKRLSVPAEAVLDAGTMKTVFVDTGHGAFEQRMVQTGARYTDSSGDRVEILKGLTRGERIVTSGTFLLNSESQMKSGGGMAGMPSMPTNTTTSPAAKPAPSKPVATDKSDMPDMPGMPNGDKK